MSDFKMWEADEEMNDARPWSGVRVFQSYRIWGKYEIPKLPHGVKDNRTYLKDRLPELDSLDVERVKARIATILIDRINEGEEQPRIDFALIDHVVENSRPLPVATRARRLLKFMTRPQWLVHRSLNLTTHEPLIEAALGASESINETELKYFLNYLVERGFVKDTVDVDGGYLVTVQGHEFIEQERSDEQSNRVFIAMWFTAELKDLWTVIAQVVERAGYEPIRIDLENYEGLIDDKIMAEIRGAEFVIADLTHGDEGQRGSVYYEVGFARALNKHVIQTVRDDHLDKTVHDRTVAFDASHYPVITWNQDDLETFASKLQNRIESRFG